MSTYLLVHGGWHGAWCWQRVVPLLREAGHLVIAPDLPGHGDDPTPLAAVTPGSDVQAVSTVLDTLAEPAILVGHSSGGMVISAAAELRPRAVRALVYLAAFLLPPGVTPPMVMRDDTEAILGSSLVVDEVQRTVSVREEALKDVFYGDCSDEDVAWARVRLVPEPLRLPVTTPVALTAETPAATAELPRFYIETLRDRALGPASQRKMYLALPCRKIYSLQTSHSPFLSAPRELADCLLDVGENNACSISISGARAVNLE
jgi:pimeloyl-ACP methyl ester carboxylesterase